MMETYYDSLIECTLMIGVNEFSGLHLHKGFNSSEIKFTSSEFYKQHILAAVSSKVAIFPFSQTKQSKYPPEEFQKEKVQIKESERPTYFKQRSQDEFLLINDLVSRYNKTNSGDKNIAVNLNKRYSKMFLSSRRKSIKAISLDNYKGSLGSVSMETIKAFPGTYFNNNLKISHSYVEPIIEILPMTDNLGNRSYAFRLEFYRMFSQNFSNTNEPNRNIEPVYETDLDSSDFIFLPCNIILFSKFPYFDLCRDIVSQLFQSIKDKSTQFIEEQLMEYTSILTRIPIMKLGNIQLEFSIDNSRYLIRPNNLIFDQIIDWDMSFLFQVLSLDDIILILCAMFQEQKIAFFSNHKNIITIICESLMVLFQPFTWKHFYLPVVPDHLYDLVDAIFPFMIGLPHNFKDKISSSYNDIVIVDLDEGTITLPKSCEIVNISKNLISRIKNSFKGRDWLTFRKKFARINTTSWEEHKETTYRIQRMFNDKSMLEFMILMVDLFHEVLFNITVEKKNDSTLVWNLDKYLATGLSENIKFFRTIYHNDNFSSFLDTKLRKTSSSSWDKICDQLYPELLAHYRLQTLKTDKVTRKPVLQIFEREENIKLTDGEQFQVLVLPTSRSHRENYYQNVLKRLGKLSQGINVDKLEIEISLQMGDKVKALYMIHQKLLGDKELFEFSKVRGLITGMDKKDKLEFESTDFSNSLSKILNINNEMKTIREDRNAVVKLFSPPNIPIPKNMFYEICRNGNITDFESIADNLFKCLTLEQKSAKKPGKSLVPPELFQHFYDNWIQCSCQFDGTDININELLDEILMINTNSYVKVDGYGQGRVLLTHLRLLFIPFGKTFIRPIIDFSSEVVTKIKMDRRLRGFGKLCEVLEVTTSNGAKKVSIWLPQDIEVWYNLISEISFGNRLSYEEKDKVIQDKMTEQCLVYDNLVKCAKQNSYFRKNLLAISKIMITTSNLNDTQKGWQRESLVHRKYLICKLMPVPKQSVTIDCALVVEKPILKNFDLWCAVSLEERFFIKIYHIISETIQQLKSLDIDIKSRVKFMMNIPKPNKVLISCNSGTIYLVSTINLAVEEFSIYESDGIYPTCGTIQVETLSLFIIYMGTNNGEIIKCNQSFNETKKMLTISENATVNFIDFYNTLTLIVGSAHEIIICSSFGEIISVIKCFQVTTISNRISFMYMEKNDNKIIIALARLPVLIEYDLTDLKDPICLRNKYLNSGNDYTPNDLSGKSESSSKYVGISYALNIQNDTGQHQLWIIYKDGTTEIFNYQTLEKLDGFNAHDGTISSTMITEIGNKKTVITIGKDDGKVILWNTTIGGRKFSSERN